MLFSLKSTLLDQDIEMREIALTTIAKILASISHETEKTKVTEEFLSKVYKTGITKFIFENLFLVQSDSPDLDSIVAQYKIAYLSLAIISALGDISGEGSIEFFEEAYKSRTAFLAFLDYVLTHRPRIHRKLLALAEASGSADRKTVCNIREKGTVFNLLNKQGLGLALRYCTMSLKISEARGRELLKCTHEVLSRALRVKGIMGEEKQALTIFNILFHSGGGFPGSFPRRLLIEYFEKTLPASKHVTKPTSDKQQEEEAEEALLKLGALFTKVEKPGTVVNTLCKTHPTFFARTWAVSCASKSQRGDRLIVSWLSIFINFAERTPAAFCRNEAYSHFKRPILRYALSAIGEFVDGAKVDLAKCFIFCFLRATFGETLNRMWRKALEQVQTTKDLMEFVANTGRPIPFIDKINLMRTILAIATCEMEKVAECEVSPQQILEPPNTKRQKQYWEYEIRYFHNSDMKKLTEELCVLCKMHREVILEPFEMECLVRIAVSSVPKYSHQKNKELKVFNKCIGEIITNKIFESVVGNGSTILPEEVFHWLTLNRQDLAEGWVDRHFVQAVMKAPHAVLPYVNSNYAGLILKTYFKKQRKSYESYDGGIAFLFLLRIVEWEDGRYFKGKSMFCQTILGSVSVIKRMLITCKNKLIVMRFMRITLMELYEKDSKYQRDKYSKYAISIGQMFVELFEVQQISGTEAEEEMALLLTVLTLLDPQSNFVIHSEESNEVYAQLIKKCEPIVNQAIKALDSPKNKMEFEFEAELYILKYTIKSQIIKIKPILHKFLQLIKSYNNNTSTVALGFQCCCLCITKNEYTKYDNIIITTTVASSVREAVLYALKDLFCEDKDVRNAAVEFVKTVVEVSPPEVLYYIRKQPGHFFCWIKILKMAADGVSIDLSHVVYLGVIAKTLKPEWVSEVLCSKSTYKEAVEMAVDTLHLQLSRCFVASPLSRALRTAIDALDPEGHKKEIREYISEVVADCDNVLLRQQQQLLLMLKVKSVKGNSQVAYFAN